MIRSWNRKPKNGMYKMVVLDTCALLWWTLSPDQLSSNAFRVVSEIDEKGAFISSITIWEIGIKLKKGTLEMGMDLTEYVRRLNLVDSLEIVPVDENIWIKNILLDWDHLDPADRTIVATAMTLNLPILTKDKVIHEFYPNSVW